MTIQVKLGRWRTRDGRVAEVTDKLADSDWRSWQGTLNGVVSRWTDEGRACCKDCFVDSDLVEPLEPAPFDLAAFIAGLKPGDYYADKDGDKQQVVGWHPVTGKLVIVTGNVSCTVGNGSSLWPAGPWVEPPKQSKWTVAWLGDFFQVLPGTYNPGQGEFAFEFMFTEGKGFELGEVVKQ